MTKHRTDNSTPRTASPSDEKTSESGVVLEGEVLKEEASAQSRRAGHKAKNVKVQASSNGKSSDEPVNEPTADGIKGGSTNDTKSDSASGSKRGFKENSDSAKQKLDNSDSQVDDLATSKKVKSSWLVRFRAYILWSLLFAVLIAVLMVTRPDTAWQIQHINALQTNVSQLNQAQQSLEARVTAQEEKQLSSEESVQAALASAKAALQNQAGSQIDSQANGRVNNQTNTQTDTAEIKVSMEDPADLVAFKNSTEQQLQQLQQSLAGLQESVAQVPGEESSAKALEKIEQGVELGIKPVADALQAQIDALSTQLTEWTTANAQAKPQTSSNPQALNALKIQQWVVEINAQWLLEGRAEQTIQQLSALEQALGLSDFAETTTLARLIGQDLARLELFLKSAQDPSETLGRDLRALKRAVNQLVLTDRSSNNVENRNGQPPNSEKQLSLGEEVLAESAFQQLVAKFEQMVTVKKRETPAEQTRVESAIMQDVLVQRAQLLVDRVEWAVQTESASILLRATSDLEGFINTHFEPQAPQLLPLLSPFTVLIFELPQPLAVMTILPQTAQ